MAIVATGQYSFVAFEAGSRHDPEGAPVEQSISLQIRGDDAHFQLYWAEVCQKMIESVRGFHDLDGDGGCPNWATWDVVNWVREVAPEREIYTAWAGNVLAGFIWLRPDFVNPDGQRILYVELLANTPTNLPAEIWSRRLKSVGIALLAFAVLRSKENGLGGRFALHADDDGAANYYVNLSNERGATLFLPGRKNVIGPGMFAHEHADLFYFETTEDGADALLEDYRHG